MTTPIQFQPLTRQTAYGRVSAAIEARIVERLLRPGDRLPSETELARQFAVNRSTVREALRRLESAGLVCRPPGGKKLFVAEPAQSDMAAQVSRSFALQDVTFIELWEAMLAIAPRIAALAAREAGTEGALQLRASILDPTLRSTHRADVERVAAFFRTLSALCGNRVLQLAHEPTARLLAPSLRRMIHRVPQARERIAAAQRRILLAVERGDALEAETWMRRHVQDFRRGYEIAGIELSSPAA